MIALFARQVFGGIGFGVVVGFAGLALLRTVDSPAVEILTTLAMTTAGYAADALAAPMATVVMGLMACNEGRGTRYRSRRASGFLSSTAPYLIAIFSILVQATTPGPLAKRWTGAAAATRP